MKQLYGVVLVSALLLCTFSSQCLAANPYKKANQSYISITGTVASIASVKGKGFTLDYGDGVIAVEADDWDYDDDSAGLYPGERVTVRGLIDDDLFETRSIEANSVYAHGRNTYYYASSADEEDIVYNTYPPYFPSEGSWVTVTGEVESVDSDDKTFELSTTFNQFEVQVDELSYNPLDKIGLQQLKPGDRVSVTGTLDKDFFDQDDIHASSIVTLSNGKKQSS